MFMQSGLHFNSNMCDKLTEEVERNGLKLVFSIITCFYPQTWNKTIEKSVCCLCQTAISWMEVASWACTWESQKESYEEKLC